MKVKDTIVSLCMFLTATAVQAQIIIGGNVYGGGNEGKTDGSTNVTIYGGDINRVYGGARMADVGGRTFVHLDAEHSASPYTLINYVYGGNDIAGTIGTSSTKTRPAELTKDDDYDIGDSWDAFVRVSSSAITPAVYYTQAECDEYNTAHAEDQDFVERTTADIKTPAKNTHNVYVGQLFGGGNGDYTYSTTPNSNGKYEVRSKVGSELLGTSTNAFVKPDMTKTYLELLGGSMVYAFGGGNNATVTNDVVICVDNPSEVVNSIKDPNNKNADPTTGELLTTSRTTQDMALNAVTTYATSDAFQIGSFFGGNNKVEMKIQPVWHLNSGKIRNIYSGGNEGDMTCPVGLLLEIPVTSSIIVDNIYGGCRKANVHPLDDNGAEVPSNSIQLEDEDYKFPSGLSARVLVRGGDINNVYGGNDISGRVWGGTAVGIYTSIRGDVYGGGNGSYAYTDNSELKDDPTWGDFYYEVPEGKTSVEALNEHRPNVEQISLRLCGTDANHLTIIGGSVYVGGNSATVVKNDDEDDDDDDDDEKQMVQLKIGSYVIADKVFLGNNGWEMIQTNEADDDNHIREGVLRTYARDDFSSLDLKDLATMYEYMNGCAMSLRPTIVFDQEKDDGTGDPETYIPYSAAIGSLYCGGNVGSMIWEGTATFDVEHAVIIYDKFVAGCNNSYVPYHEGLNAVYWGGVVGTEDEQKPGGMENSDGSIKDAIVLNLSGLKIQPMRWVTKRDGSYVPILSADGKPIYMANCEHDCELSTINAVCEHGKQAYLEWNTFDVSTGEDVANPAELDEGATRSSTTDDINRRLKGGNIYGGCYTAGVVNGNVVINVNETIMDRDDVFANVKEDELGEGIYYETNEYHITKVNSGVIIDEQGMDVLGKAMNIFGGGFGKDTEIWGSTTINLNEGYVFQIFGGAEEGVIGKPEIESDEESDEVEFPLIYTTTTLADGTYDATTGLYAFNGYLYKANERYSTHINLDGGQSGVSRHSTDDTDEMAETEFIYGGAFEGPIMGSTIIHLGNGRIFNSFAGSCNADICGHTETYVGLNASETPGFPWIRDHIYGGNDLGGRILGSKDFMGRVREEVTNIKNNIYDKDHSTKAAAYIEYQQGRVDYIFGGCYGTYDYTDRLFEEYTNDDGSDKTDFTKPRLGNAFVNFRPVVSNNPLNKAKRIYGAGQGISVTTNNNQGLNFGMDIMQDRSYILIDIPTESTEFNDLVVFGAGKSGGLGMGIDAETAKSNPDAVSAVIDLFRGNISGGNVYGGSDVEGVTRRTVVNVPSVSTIHVNSIFGGAYGSANNVPCDVYEARVNYSSSTAMVGGYHTGIYGGNNAYRRTVHSIVNINAPVYSDIEKGWLATVYGAGLGENTWSQYTEVNLNNNARVFEVYGGGSEGRVLNMESLKMWSILEPTLFTKIGDGYDDWTLDNALAKANGLGLTCNANVYINKGANVSGYIYNGSLSGGYAYGAGLGATATVSGTTYAGLHGGYVAKDIYGSGSNGSVFDQYKHQRDTYNSTAATENKISDFTAGTNVYIEGGKARRAYGGGYQGNVGYTELPFTVTDESSVATVLANDVLATTNVVIGIPETQKAAINAAHADDVTQPEYGFYKGVPTVEWNAYGGGEKGGVIGTAYVKMYNGYVGYRYLGSDAVITGNDVVKTDDSTTPIDERFIEKVDDETVANGGRNSLIEHGNLFGSGFDDGSYVDNTDVSLYGGYVRNSVYGGGEIAAVGRGETKESGTDNTMRELKGIWKGGSTKVSIFSGHVLQNVFGGGKGFTAERGEEYGLSTVRRYTDGYVFGRTEANVHGGEIGTEDGLAKGYGNVFGGGNVGYVYSSIGKKNPDDGFYYQFDENGDFVHDPVTHEMILTEGTKVMISPYCRVTNPNGVEVNGHAYAYGDFVPTEDLNTLPYKDVSECPQWDSMDTNTGIVIHNAVFAGGNVTQGSDLLYAQATTVYGNATASLDDVFCRDLITLGEDGVGGLYGDGNLTFVDGYRELNITNFGTDYYGLSQTLEYEDYLKLNDRERAYFKLQYKCITPYGDFNEDDVIDEEVYDRMSEEDQAHWEVVQGVCSIYAGRMMNTIQRADFCGVFGSRLVMKGAQDRIPSEVDYTNYTINRVGEVSLNQKAVGGVSHGNYFGIYNITKYLGALTSDVEFNSTRKVLTNGSPTSDTMTYHDYKSGKQGQRDRNIGHSENELAMASGVYLELLKEPSRNYVGDEKIWGPVTGVVGLKLIATSTGEGGGYVYAKNIHGTQTKNTKKHLTISQTNQDAITQYSYDYASSTPSQWMESSGNFVIDSPSSIIDDCFPNTNSFTPEYGTTGGDDTSPAHYWYIHGYFYVYNQEISAYTGSSQAYTQTVNIPLTITAQGNGKLWIEDIKTNLYADASKFPFKAGSTTERETEVICNGTTYRSNDPITYWDWSNLGTAEKAYFVETSYVCVMDVYANDDDAENNVAPAHKAGEVLSGETDYNTYKDQSWYDENGQELAGTRAFRVTNGLSHEKGYELAVSLDNPAVWDEYFTDPASGVTVAKGSEDTNDLLGPTYKLNGSSTDSHVFGQQQYILGDLVEEPVVDNYEGISTAAKNNIDTDIYPQAVFEPAYMALEDCYITVNGNQTVHVVKHGAIPESYYGQLSADSKTNFVAAYILTNTVQLTDQLLLSGGVLFTGNEKDGYIARYSDKVNAVDFPRAYYCLTPGYYGGKEFSGGTSYQAVQYSGLSAGERSNFTFNYDALDIMLDDTYAGNIGYYDKDATNSPLYSKTQYVNYSVMYTGTKTSLRTKTGGTFPVVNNGTTTYSRLEYESLLNEKQYYTPISLNFNGGTSQSVYVVTQEIGQGGRVYPVGTTLTASEYASLDAQKKQKVTSMTFNKGTGGDVQKFYYCGEAYTTRTAITPTTGSEITVGGNVPQGTILAESVYNDLPNEQVDFNVIAASPQEKSAFYVSSDCDIYDFSQDRIFTVIYRYSYTEKDSQGNSIESISERHVLNIRVHFESGEPAISELLTPAIILPGSTVGLNQPTVDEGAFTVLGGGWELYQNFNDAIAHKNGVPYTNNTTPMYWYQNDWYVAYYAETYLGRTYSNAVPFTIANYHDLDDVMSDAEHHMYVDHPDVERNSKIYIDDRDCTSDGTKSELDLLKDFFDLSLQKPNQIPLLDENNQPVLDENNQPILIDDPTFIYHPTGWNKDHSALNDHVEGGANLEFILNSNVAPKAYTDWTPIGDGTTQCFEGTLHGDGYTISGLSNSLFDKLCGSVYNLGVTGTFTTAGIVNTGEGYVENCWISTTGTPDAGVHAIFNNPTREDDDHPVQIVNCYYPADNAYTAVSDDANYETSHGYAIMKPRKSFNNGEVAYDLNGFYLAKRYADNTPSITTNPYKYFTIEDNANNTLSTDPSTGHYANSKAIYPITSTQNSSYVESRYIDGDFIYAGGTIPTDVNERYYAADSHYYPIWPDDYIFFGQMLTYGYFESNRPYQITPSHITKSDRAASGNKDGVTGWLVTGNNSNRVYRAPAYFRNSNMDVAHFNIYCMVPTASTEETGSLSAYPGMTAIDFTGYNDNSFVEDWASDGIFNKKVLDFEGLTGFRSDGQTQNLLAYANESETNVTTILSNYFGDRAFNLSNADYKTVAAVNAADMNSIKGHLVKKNSSDDYVTSSDHLLVDKQDFNAPISYTFGSAYRMWYQRTPDKFVDRTKGWEDISIPFKAELVTTQQKGEITHFYSGSYDYFNDKTGYQKDASDLDSKVGHEYWLREFTDITETTENNVTTATAMMKYPTAIVTETNENDKEVTNYFLWDYYYSKNSQKDANSDIYQTYYNSPRTYKDYPLLAAGTPYIIGFPGSTYYEFDLSGNFTAQNTYAAITKLAKQTITFASPTGFTIGVSDDETGVSINGDKKIYSFVTNYLNQSFSAGTDNYTLNVIDGSKYDRVPAAPEEGQDPVPDTKVSAFRPYFTSAVIQSGGARPVTRSIIFSNEDSQLKGVEEKGDPSSEDLGNLSIYAKKHKIVVESALKCSIDVRIVNAAGLTVNTFTLEPGETVETRINNAGVYIVQSADSRYTKKLLVK